MVAPSLYAVLADASDYNLPDARVAVSRHYGIGDMFRGYSPATPKPDYLARAQDTQNMLQNPESALMKKLFEKTSFSCQEGRKLFNGVVIDSLLRYRQ
jgi:hypothetical protein